MRIRSAIAYGILLLLTYIPQFVASLEPIKTELEYAPPIFVSSFSAKSAIIGILVAVSIASVYFFFMSYHGGRDRNYVIKFYISLLLISFISFIYIMFEDAVITISFQLAMIPIIASSVIGIVGSFIITCIINSNCDTRPKGHRRKITGSLYS